MVGFSFPVTFNECTKQIGGQKDMNECEKNLTTPELFDFQERMAVK